MSTVFTRIGADYSQNSRGLISPVPSGLLGWWYFGGLSGDDTPTALARTKKNLASSGNSAALVGAPSIGTGFIQMDAANYISTDIAETLDFTYMVLALPTVTNPRFAGNWGGGDGTLLYAPTGTLPTQNLALVATKNVSGTHTQASSTTTAIANWTGMKLISGKVDATAMQFTASNLTDGTVATAAITPGARIARSPAVNLYFAGPGGGSGAGATSKYGFAAIWNRCLTVGEEASVRSFVAKYRLAKFGEVI